MDKSFSGKVVGFSGLPGRTDLVNVQVITGPGLPEDSYSVSAEDPASNVTCEGKKVDAAELLAWLLTHNSVIVTLHPEAMRYGVSVRAEFEVAGA